TVEKRIKLINNHFTYSLYLSVCRSLFEKHKLMFAFLVCVRIMMNDNKIDMHEWHYLLSGGSVQLLNPNPASDWLSDRAWRDIQSLSSLEHFADFTEHFANYLDEFKGIFDSQEPH
ncbi:hypothetical protein scyTo_0023034, partial [Scyliorhinus torazame]|nr:hypothetical protein [Scyliorhinus torazame]